SLYTEIKKLKEKAGISDLENKLGELSAKIKDVARASEPSAIHQAESDGFRVTVARTFRKWFDMKAIKKFASKAEFQIINDEALKTELDREKFEELVKSGLISRELRQKSFREEEMTPRVSIVPPKKDK
ncbi:hypothetical protein LCGC14_2568310, partial [marine sediment metagenome]